MASTRMYEYCRTMLVMLPGLSETPVGQDGEQRHDDDEGDVDAALPQVAHDQGAQVARPDVQADGGSAVGAAGAAVGGLVVVIRRAPSLFVMSAMRFSWVASATGSSPVIRPAESV